MIYSAGLDIGSKTTKLVFLSQDEITGHYVIATGANSRTAANNILNLGINDQRLEQKDIKYLLVTGYGRHTLFPTKALSEITCQAVGTRRCFPNDNVIIDIGGQDFKVIKVNKSGDVVSFAMNDKCAAGTGRYLELMANIFAMDLDVFSRAAQPGSIGREISSVCTVFAETEVINYISQGVDEKQIISGIFMAVSKRVYALAQRFIDKSNSLILTGGVAKNIGVANALEKITGCSIHIPAEPQITAALGAAILAQQLKADFVYEISKSENFSTLNNLVL